MSNQKLPQKIKKKKNLNEEDKEKCEEYYNAVNDFIEKNKTNIDKKYKNLDYFFEFDEKKDIFIGDKYQQNLESFGYYDKKNKKMYLSIEEAFYLYQLGYINFKPDVDFNNFNLVKLNLYSYLRRKAKILIVSKILSLIDEINKNEINDKNDENLNINENEINDIDKYYILFEDSDDYKRHKVKSILYQHDSEENLNYILFQNIINNSKQIYNLYQKINKIKSDEFKSDIIISITQGASITFLKLDDTIKI